MMTTIVSALFASEYDNSATNKVNIQLVIIVPITVTITVIAIVITVI